MIQNSAPARMSAFKDNWLSLTAKYNADKKISENIFADLLKKYTESGRHYHNDEHIGSLLSLVESWKYLIKDRDAIEFAIWFHDCIYVPMRRDNEEKSALYARTAMQRMQIEEAMTEKVWNYVMATAGHLPASKDTDLQLFMDMDLSILGAPEEVYLQYSNQIRKEYRMVPDLLYKSGRKELLKNLLKRDRLFYVLDQYEQQARENLRDEIERLKFSLW